MAFVKLDCGILNSTLWVEREPRELFITALLMAEPFELTEPAPQIAVGSMQETGFIVPPGWYGFVAAAGPGIVRRAYLDDAAGMVALARLGSPDPESRSKEYDGRRLVRIDGGFIVLNYMKYRERDYTGAERSKRYRDKKLKDRAQQSTQLSTEQSTKPSHRDGVASHRDITHAEVEVEAEVEPTNKQGGTSLRSPPVDKSNGKTKPPNGWWNSEAGILQAGASLHPPLTPKKGESWANFKTRIEAAL